MQTLVPHGPHGGIPLLFVKPIAHVARPGDLAERFGVRIPAFEYITCRWRPLTGDCPASARTPWAYTLSVLARTFRVLESPGKEKLGVC
jgi:hypothetical protein